MRFYKTTIFWERIRNSLALFGPSGGVIAGTYFENTMWTAIGLGCLAISGLIAIWFVDHDKNGFVDLFEEEKTTE